jgi:hypothetical protein
MKMCSTPLANTPARSVTTAAVQASSLVKRSRRCVEAGQPGYKFLEMMMLWPLRKKKQARRLTELSFDERIMAAENVMACRDVVGMFLAIIAQHQEDGHECLPYCSPPQMFDYLRILDAQDMRMLLTIALKDMHENYLKIEPEEDQGAES